MKRTIDYSCRRHILLVLWVCFTLLKSDSYSSHLFSFGEGVIKKYIENLLRKGNNYLASEADKNDWLSVLVSAGRKQESDHFCSFLILLEGILSFSLSLAGYFLFMSTLSEAKRYLLATLAGAWVFNTGLIAWVKYIQYRLDAQQRSSVLRLFPHMSFPK